MYVRAYRRINVLGISNFVCAVCGHLIEREAFHIIVDVFVKKKLDSIQVMRNRLTSRMIVIQNA